MAKGHTILIIDKDEVRRQNMAVILEFLGESACVASSNDWCEKVRNPQHYLAVIVGDTGESSITDLSEALSAWAGTLPLLLLDKPTTPALRNFIGVIEQPLSYAQIVDCLHRCHLYSENSGDTGLKNTKQPTFQNLAGNSEGMRKIRKMIVQVANTDATVLIRGASGTGKEVVARTIHEQSTRANKAFVAVNCGAIPSELLESELFGHEKGAFTGAITSRQGRFEAAQGGTLFLDEIGDMPIQMQVKLLRVLQERCFERVGSNKSVSCDVRIIAATHCNLEQLIGQGKFREDLFYRLNVFPIELPSLQQRIEDLPIILNELIARLVNSAGRTLKFLPEALDSLSEYPWPGNIRELANLVERLAILYPNKVITPDVLPLKLQAGAAKITKTAIPLNSLSNNSQGVDLKQYLIDTELGLIKQALAASEGIVARAAAFLKIRRTTLIEKMRKYGMQRESS